MTFASEKFLATRATAKLARSLHEVNRMAREIEKAGHKVVRLVQGEPDFDTPAHIKRGAEAALAKGMTHYSPVEGLEEVRRVVAEKIKRDTGVIYSPEKELLITNGGTLGLFMAVQAILNPGDEIIVPEITFGPYLAMISMAEAKPVFLPVERKGENFLIHWEEISRRCTRRTKAILLNNPQNPLGVVMSQKDLEAVGEAALKSDLMVISDEVYENLVFDRMKHVSFSSLSAELKERTILVNSFSKTYAMTGWRVGFNAANPEVTKAMARIYQGSARCAAPFTQLAVKAAIEGPQECVEEMRLKYDERRKVLYEGLKKIDGLVVPYPQGAFYIFVDVKAFGMPSWDLTIRILEEGHVVVSPGSYYGPGGEGYVRFSYATPKEEILIGLEGIEKALRSIKR